MAKKPKPAQSDSDMKLDYIPQLVGEIALAEERGQDSRSALGNLYKRAQDDYNVPPQVLKHVRRLQKMTVEKRDEFLRATDKLLQVLGLEPQPDLFEEDPVPAKGRAKKAVDHDEAVLN